MRKDIVYSAVVGLCGGAGLSCYNAYTTIAGAILGALICGYSTYRAYKREETA